jgi:hypothetical protein
VSPPAGEMRTGDTATADPAGRPGTDAPPGDTDAPGEPSGGPSPTGDGAAAPRHGLHPGLVVAGLTAVLALPLVVALAALHSPRWYPLLDLAQTEMRVRDVGTRHTPLVGLIGRVVVDGRSSSHPGPISFYALAPVYRLLGGGAWGLLAGVVVLNVAALALAMWMAVRRGGAALAVGVAAAVALLLRSYGTRVLTEPWNPYMPVLWWLVALLAVWSVLCDDLAMLPVAVFAGSFCMQTHVSYLGLAAGMVAVAFGAVVVALVRRWADWSARRRLLAWTGGSLALGVVLWIPPLLDQLRNDPGNARQVLDYFRDPPTGPLGLSRGAELYATHLNLWRFLVGDQGTTGSALPAIALVALWLAAAAVAWRRPGTPPALRRLHAVIAVALALGLVSSARIVGQVWFYLTLWAWGITALILVAVGWTAASALAGGGERARRLARAVPALAAAVLVVCTVQFTVRATGAEVSQPRLSAQVAALAPPTRAALDPRGRHLVTWTDPTALGSTGWGLLNDLERAGFTVGVIPAHGVGATPHRVLPAREATDEVHVAVGPDIAAWRARPGALEVARVDARTPAERRTYARLRAGVQDALAAPGKPHAAADIDGGLFSLYLDTDLPAATRRDIQRMIDLGSPTAVFVAPVAPA